ncbi:hypothetical protein [Hydrogenophaga taeniospiralis]|uniref:hypothetical protein n=1 Tax=Hydrogenophaga taeniospiralis TaxID=65656 RepID=UPI001CFB2951|nr:hypothetical protein [Hydrogenophaga taeniospiralis]UCU92680.1 hypothetical protein KI616_17830 [Hydrogenophaga taeniospiralis]
MAAAEGFGGRAVDRLISWIAVPRGFTFPSLILISLGLGELAWRHIESVKILAWVSGMASPFCMLCATAVWAMRDRLDDVIDSEQMTSEEYKNFESLVSLHRARSTSWAATSALMALLASAPAVSSQLVGPIWQWMVIGSSGAVGFSLYSYMIANHWEKQIRAYKSQQRLADKRRKEKSDLITAISAGAGSLEESGWKEGPLLSTPVQHRH